MDYNPNTPGHVNDSRWLTHDDVYQAVRFGSSDTLRVYARECAAVGATGLSDELEGYADLRDADALSAAEEQAYRHADTLSALRQINRAVRSAHFREPHGTLTRADLAEAITHLRILARSLRTEL